MSYLFHMNGPNWSWYIMAEVRLQTGLCALSVSPDPPLGPQQSGLSSVGRTDLRGVPWIGWRKDLLRHFCWRIVDVMVIVMKSIRRTMTTTTNLSRGLHPVWSGSRKPFSDPSPSTSPAAGTRPEPRGFRWLIAIIMTGLQGSIVFVTRVSAWVRATSTWTRTYSWFYIWFVINLVTKMAERGN